MPLDHSGTARNMPNNLHNAHGKRVNAPVCNRWILSVHVAETLGYLLEDTQDVSLRHVAMISCESLDQVLVAQLHLHIASR